jgi:hypothetical protein
LRVDFGVALILPEADRAEEWAFVGKINKKTYGHFGDYGSIYRCLYVLIMSPCLKSKVPHIVNSKLKHFQIIHEQTRFVWEVVVSKVETLQDDT